MAGASNGRIEVIGEGVVLGPVSRPGELRVLRVSVCGVVFWDKRDGALLLHAKDSHVEMGVSAPSRVGCAWHVADDGVQQ